MKIDMETGEVISGSSITETLALIGDGMFLDTVSEKMSELVTAVNRSGKKGKMSLSITIKKATTRGGAMHISGDVKITPPAEEPMEVMLFASEGGNLVADDPAQEKLDFKPGIAAAELGR